MRRTDEESSSALAEVGRTQGNDSVQTWLTSRPRGCSEVLLHQHLLQHPSFLKIWSPVGNHLQVSAGKPQMQKREPEVWAMNQGKQIFILSSQLQPTLC